MATHAVGSSAPLYANLADWEAARASGSDATERAELEDESHTTGCDIDTWTGSATAVEIVGEDAQDGAWATGPRFALSSGYVVTMTETDLSLTMEDLTVDITGGFFVRVFTMPETSGYSSGLTYAFRRCMFYASAANFGNSAINVGGSSNGNGTTTLTVENCVFREFDGSSHGIELSYSSGQVLDIDVELSGCTFDESFIGPGRSNNSCTITAVGCLFKAVSGSDDLDLGEETNTWTYTSTSNITSDSSATHNSNWDTVTNLSAGVTFNDSGTPSSGEVSWTNAPTDYSLVDNANNEALGHVTSGTMPSADILGTTRDASPDAGAFEVVTAVGDVTVDVPVASLTLTGLAPTAEADVQVDVPLGELPLTAYAPDPQVNVTVDVPVGELPLTAYAPDVLNDVEVPVPVATLEATAYAPSVGTPVEIDVPAASTEITGYPPDIVNDVEVAVPVATTELTGYPPTVGNDVEVVVPVASTEITGYPPDVENDVEVSIPVATTEITTYAPSIGNSVDISVPVATTEITAYPPDIVNDVEIPIPVAVTELTGYPPDVATDLEVVVPVATTELTGYAPSISAGVGTTVTVPVSGLELTGLVPTPATGPEAVISSANWSTPILLNPGDEWRICLSGPSVNNVKVRVSAIFRST